MAAFGCTLGGIPHMVAAITGLAAILNASAIAFQAIKWLGVAYLLHLAWQTLRGKSLIDVDASTAPVSFWRVIRIAILINLLTPKLTIFFFAFLPQFVPAGEVNGTWHMVGLSLVFMALTFVVFSHDPALRAEFPQLAVATLTLEGVTDTADVTATATPFRERASARLAERSESEFPETAAWRRAFVPVRGAEALLRRFKKDGELPPIYPLVDLCNAVSLAYAIPIAVFDLDQVTGDLTVTLADDTETYLSFGGTTEMPEPGEVIFGDDAGNAHARRWTNRQSARSAIRLDTRRVLIVGEALHDTAPADVAALRTDLAGALGQHW